MHETEVMYESHTSELFSGKCFFHIDLGGGQKYLVGNKKYHLSAAGSMNRFLLAGAAAVVLWAAPVVAADVPVKASPAPIWNWTGFYIGFHGAVRCGPGGF